MTYDGVWVWVCFGTGVMCGVVHISHCSFSIVNIFQHLHKKSPPCKSYSDWYSLAYIQPERAPLLQLVDWTLLQSFRCDHELLILVDIRHAGHTRISHFVRIRITCLDEARHCACVALIGQRIRLLHSVDLVPLQHVSIDCKQPVCARK